MSVVSFRRKPHAENPSSTSTVVPDHPIELITANGSRVSFTSKEFLTLLSHHYDNQWVQAFFNMMVAPQALKRKSEINGSSYTRSNLQEMIDTVTSHPDLAEQVFQTIAPFAQLYNSLNDSFSNQIKGAPEDVIATLDEQRKVTVWAPLGCVISALCTAAAASAESGEITTSVYRKERSSIGTTEQNDAISEFVSTLTRAVTDFKTQEKNQAKGMHVIG